MINFLSNNELLRSFAKINNMYVLTFEVQDHLVNDNKEIVFNIFKDATDLDSDADTALFNLFQGGRSVISVDSESTASKLYEALDESPIFTGVQLFNNQGQLIHS